MLSLQIFVELFQLEYFVVSLLYETIPLGNFLTSDIPFVLYLLQLLLGPRFRVFQDFVLFSQEVDCLFVSLLLYPVLASELAVLAFPVLNIFQF